MSESKFTRRICSELENEGCEVYPIVAQTMGKSGWPDRLVICKEGVWLLEFKSYGGELRKRQQLVMQRINRVRSDTAWVVREGSVGDLDKIGVLEDSEGREIGRFGDARALIGLLSVQR